MTSNNPSTETDFDPIRDNGYYLFMDNFNYQSCEKAIRWIITENLRKTDRKEFLTLVICSPGGLVSTCFALVDTMKGSAIPIRTVAIGQIASCGFIAFIAGEKGHRILTPNTSILSHQYSAGSSGKEHDLYASQKGFELTSERILKHYMKCIDGMTEKKIREYLLPAHDVWLSAKQAKKLKCCDEVKEVY